MISEKILRLLAKKIGKAATEEEIIELHQLLQDNPEYYFLIEVLQSVEGEKSHKGSALEEEYLVRKNWLLLEQELKEIKPKTKIIPLKIEQKERKSFFHISFARAAVWIGLIILAGSTFILFNNPGKKNRKTLASTINQVQVPFGVTVKKMLPDSSVVWLNAGSHIRYDDNFIQKNRDVYLDGEAYFSVKHDANHPFIVHAGNITVRALGTKFNIQAYQNENKIEATLISGKILVKIAGKSDHSVILVPNEKLIVTNEKSIFSEKNNSVPKELSFEVKEVVQIPSIASVPEVAWLQDKLAFQNEAFDELAKRMERRYDIQIIFKDSTLGKERLSGIFENENIQKALGLLQMTTAFHYKEVGDTVLLSR